MDEAEQWIINNQWMKFASYILCSICRRNY